MNKQVHGIRDGRDVEAPRCLRVATASPWLPWPPPWPPSPLPSGPSSAPWHHRPASSAPFYKTEQGDSSTRGDARFSHPSRGACPGRHLIGQRHRVQAALQRWTRVSHGARYVACELGLARCRPVFVAAPQLRPFFQQQRTSAVKDSSFRSRDGRHVGAGSEPEAEALGRSPARGRDGAEARLV